MMEKYQFMYLLGIALGWISHRYFDISGATMTFGLLLSIPLYFLMNWMWP